MPKARLRNVATLALAPALAACIAPRPGPQSAPAPTAYLPPLGSNQVFRARTAAAPGHELIVADLRLPPDAVGEAHWHPWEEFLYVIEGSAVIDLAGRPRPLAAGESFVIPARTVHTPRAGPRGFRAIVTRVHDEGDPVSIPAGD